MKIGILTGGGDCPGLNSAIRMVTKRLAYEQKAEVYGFLDGFRGVIEQDYKKLDYDSVSNILDQGGTILGTSNKYNPFRVYTKDGTLDKSDDAIRFMKEIGIKCLFSIGGDGTQTIAAELARKGLPVIGIPKTIDNDLVGSDIAIGFKTAAAFVSDAVMRVRTTAESHHRILVVETMGRYAGWLAMYGGSASGADVILIPEFPYKIEKIADFVTARAKKGRKYSVVVVSEGVKSVTGEQVVRRVIKDSPDPVRLGGIGAHIAKKLEDMTGIEARVTVLGHLQRGGRPLPEDRLLASRLAYHAVDLFLQGKTGMMAAVQKGSITQVSMETPHGKQRFVTMDDQVFRMERSIGTCFGF